LIPTTTALFIPLFQGTTLFIHRQLSEFEAMRKTESFSDGEEI
jgi:hypothetical protein